MKDLDNRFELTELDALSPEMEPSPEVEERLVGALRKRGLLADSPLRPISAWWQLAAVVLIAATVGWVGRGLIEPPGLQPTTGREFLLILSEPEALRTTKPEAELVEEYRGWASKLSRQGGLVHSGKLVSGGHLLTSSVETRQPLVTDGGLDTVTGYFQVRAGSWDEALELARTCPHLAYGGEISVRMLEQI